MSNQPENTSLTKQVNIDGVIYYHMPIQVAIKYSDKITSGFFIPLSETKRVRIHLEDGDIADKMSTYKDKGLESILLAEEDYYEFIKKIKRGMISFFLKDDEAESQILSIPSMLNLVKKVVKYIGISDDVIEISEETVLKVLTQFKSISVINNPLRKFQKDNQDEFLKNLMISYSAIGLIKELNWTTPQIKEKIVQICLFSDISLSSDDYTKMILVNFDHSKYPKNIQDHPLTSAKIVAKTQNAVPKEVIQAIEQHHELPDGSGYPKEIKGLSINQLSAVQIIARTFIDKLIESDFAYEDRENFISTMLEKFNYNNFSQPCKALYLLMGLEPKKQEVDYD